MSRLPQPPFTDRRRFLVTIGLAGLSSALVPTALSMAQAPTPAPGSGPAKPDSTAAPAAPAGPAEISGDARSLGEIVRRRYGKHLNAEQLEAVIREMDGRIQGGKRLRESKLANGEEPDFTFHA